MTIQIKKIVDGNFQGYVDVSAKVYGLEYNESLVHQIITAYQAKGRLGTKKQKTRAEVSGGGIKPWKQKGSGRARAGTTRSPIWRTGGVTFAAKNRDFSQKVNKKMYRGAMRVILSELVRTDRLVICDEFEKEFNKTKEVADILDTVGVGNILIVTDVEKEKLNKVARNIPKIIVKNTFNVDPLSLVKSNKVIFLTSAVKLLEERLS